ncbi:CoA transferase [Gordonia crocea]|uniref:CoA transferase n=2 Tax=Gordonia crocea TaxID=589162 RepID=A0A7M3STV2_9ACTN|nr:CoA transferase [Gordonia crocea]
MTTALSGPYGTLVLAALGAEVIKIEAPGGNDLARTNPPFATADGELGLINTGDDESLSFLARNRGKRSIELDLKHEAGREVFFGLARASDVVFENLSDGAADRLGLGYEAVRAVNPAIVYCSLSGLGRPEGSAADQPALRVKAMDIIVQALSGAMDTTGEVDGPPLRFGLPVADLMAPLYAVIGIQSALIQRARTGEGQRVDVSMLESLASLLPFEHLDVLQRAGYPPRSGNFHNRLAPFGVYPTVDGHVAIAAASDAWVAALFDAMGRPDLMADPRFAGRGPRAANSAALNALIEEWTSGMATDAVVAELGRDRGVPCAQVRSAAEVMADEELTARGVIGPLVHPTAGELDAVAGGVPIMLSGAEVSLPAPAPLLGADTDAVLRELVGLDDETLARLRSAGTI